jgi:hypothetical protein
MDRGRGLGWSQGVEDGEHERGGDPVDERHGFAEGFFMSRHERLDIKDMSRHERLDIRDPCYVRLEPGKMRQWLEGKAPEQVCGMSNCWGRCPLATYLREANDASDIRVGEHTYRLLLPAGDTGDCPLPDWAMRFVDYVDAGPDLRRVTVAEALELLERAAPAHLWAQTQKAG